MSITRKRQAFVEEYLQCWNATRAAIAAGYSERSAKTTSHRLMENADVREAIQARVSEKAMGADEVLLRLADQAKATMEDFVTVEENGDIRFDLEKARLSGKIHLIKTISPTPQGFKIELHDQQKALELIGKAHGLFREVKEHRGEVPVRIVEVKGPDGE